MNKTPINLKSGDTKLEDIKYGVDIEVIVHGKVHLRHFKEKFCECGNQILAQHHWTLNGYAIAYNYSFKQKQFCSVQCVTNNRMEVRRGIKKSEPKAKPKRKQPILSQGYPALLVSKQRAVTMVRFIRSL